MAGQKFFNDLGEAEKILMDAAERGDWILCRQIAALFFEEMTREEAKAWKFRDFDHAMHWARVFSETGLEGPRTGSALDIFDMRLWDYVLRNTPEEMRGIIHEGFRQFADVSPCGYTDEGEACISAEDAARALGVSVEELMKAVEDAEASGVEFPKVAPDKVRKIH